MSEVPLYPSSGGGSKQGVGLYTVVIGLYSIVEGYSSLEKAHASVRLLSGGAIAPIGHSSRGTIDPPHRDHRGSSLMRTWYSP